MFEEYGGFVVPVWSRSVEISKEEEVYHTLKSAPLAVGAGGVESSGVKLNIPGVLLEIFKYRKSFVDLDCSSVDKVKCRFTCTMKMSMLQWKLKG